MANSFDRVASPPEYRGYALLIGVGECSTYPTWSLPVTVKDVTAIKEILVDPSLCGYPDNDRHIRLLCNETATRAAILAGLQWLKETADRDPEATIVVYYSGHGCLNPGDNSYYLIPHDADPMDFGNSALAGADFTNAIRSINSQKLLVILDCCHAEGVASAKEDGSAFKLPSGLKFKLPPGFVPESAKGQFSTLAEGKGVAILSSSDSNQISWIKKDQSCSVFTYHLIEALRGACNHEGDRSVTVMNLIEYLGKAVPVTAKSEHQAEQTPQSEYKGSNHFPTDWIDRGGKTPNPTPKPSADSIDSEQGTSEKGIKVKNQGSRVEVPVFFATDRQHLDTRSVKTYYGGKRNPTSQLEYGIAKVSIPEDHRMGQIERTSWLKLEFQEDPAKHLVLMDINPTFRTSIFTTHVSHEDSTV
jgi:Caspase domain